MISLLVQRMSSHIANKKLDPIASDVPDTIFCGTAPVTGTESSIGHVRFQLRAGYALLGSWQDVGSEEVGRHLSKVQVSG